jgi:RPA family protein
MEETKSFERQTALKTTIQELLLGDYIQEDENTPNYLLTKSGTKIYRCNLMAIILSKEQQGSITNILVDDGTGKITLRSFEKNEVLEKLEVGTAILIVGKLRIYNQEKYLSSEIVKKIEPLWLKLRALELKELIEKKDDFVDDKKENIVNEVNKVDENKDNQKNDVEKNTNETETRINEEEETISEEAELLPVQKLTNLIKELDTGDGVLIEEVISKSPLNETEQLIEKMLENGDIFQNLPGKVKVL